MKSAIYFYQILMSLFIFSPALSEAQENSRWPIPDWEVAINQDQLQTDQCKEFSRFSHSSKNFLTDGLIVIKDGQIVYETYDNKNGMTQPHILWSATKTLTGILLGTAVRDGRISLNQNVEDFYPNASANRNYSKIKIENLLYLDAGYRWQEKIFDVTENPVINMLFGKGHSDMAQFTASQKMGRHPPGKIWNYSTGLPTLTMGILKKIYGPEYESLPWKNLFLPLGIHNATFERDNSGTFIGGANSYLTLRDFAKIGYLFLNNGQWERETIFPPDWMQVMLTPSPGYLSAGTVVKDVTETGVYGGSLWLNKKVKQGQGKPYPFSPEDMYLAIGHMGQILVVLPTQKMVIARTGYDHNFKEQLDPFISRAIACFDNPDFKIAPIAKHRNDRPSLSKILKNVHNVFQGRTLQASMAKILCSCHLVSHLDLPTCLKRNDFGPTKYITKIHLKKSFESDGTISIGVRLSGLVRIFSHNNFYAKAYFDPENPNFGCLLK